MDKEYIQSYIDELQRNSRQNRTFQSDGINFCDTGSGTNYSLPADIYQPDLGDFLVNVNGNGSQWTVNVAKGRVLYRSSPNSLTGGCLKEFEIQGFAVWPIDGLYVGDYPNSPWVQEGGYCNINNAEDGGSDAYGVYIIANQYRVHDGTLLPGVPYLALMPIGGDAETKTKPWNEDGCDQQVWYNFFEYQPITILVPDAPYEVSGNLENSQVSKLQNYNCQRIKLASIYWNSTDKVWTVRQFISGTVTIPYNIHYAGVYRFEITDPPTDYPSWYTTPYFDSRQADWEGFFTDCEKWDGTGLNPTSAQEL